MVPEADLSPGGDKLTLFAEFTENGKVVHYEWIKIRTSGQAGPESLKKQIKHLLSLCNSAHSQVPQKLPENILRLTENYLLACKTLPFQEQPLEDAFGKCVRASGEDDGSMTVLKTRLALLRGDSEPNVQPVVSDTPALSALLGNTLVLYILIRQYQHGTLNRSIAEKLRYSLEQQRNSMKTESRSQWAASLMVICQTLLDRAKSLDDKDIKQAQHILEDPLFLVDEFAVSYINGLLNRG
jgi:hypothetical protein